MQRLIQSLVPMLLLLLAPWTAQALEVFACEPEWGALLAEIAGDHATVTVATTAMQDPHHIQARPSLIAAISRAQLVVCTGADLEIGWLPLLLRRAGNPNIQVGTQGYFLAADFVRKLEKPQRLDRSQGDLHPQGNPHVHLNPHNIVRIAKALNQRLVELDSGNEQAYDDRLDDFLQRWNQAIDQWEQRAGNLAGLRLASHNLMFSYLADWLDLKIVATLEAKVGIPPSGSHLARLLKQLSPNPPAAIIRTPYADDRPSEWLSKRLNIPAIVLPYTVGGTPGATDLFGLFDDSLNRLQAVAP